MPRKALGDRPLTAAERQVRQRERNKALILSVMIARDEMRSALQRIIEARTIHEARRIAAAALEYGSAA